LLGTFESAKIECMPEENPPLLVVEGRPLKKIRMTIESVGILWVLLCVLGFILLWYAGAPEFVFAVVVGAAFVVPIVGGPFVFAHAARAKAGKVEFFEDRVRFVRPLRRKGNLDEATRDLSWNDLKGVTVGAGGGVQLVTGRELGRAPFFLVPILREHDRAVVLELLEKRGVPRLDAGAPGGVFGFLDTGLDDEESVTDPEKALLIVRGYGPGVVRNARLIGRLLPLFALIGTYFAAKAGFFQDEVGHTIVRVGHVFTSWPLIGYGLSLGLAFLVGLGALAAERFVRGRVGTVAFYDDRVELLKPRRKAWRKDDTVDQRIALSWSSVRGFRDDQSDSIQLMASSERKEEASLLTVPTLRESDRVAVLKFLDERAVPRLDA
jgi:hypothetical protein